VLSGENLVKLNNTYAASVLTYSFGVNKWNPTDPQKIQTCTWSLLTKYSLHHTAAVVRVSLPRKYGGRGLRNISALHNRQIFNMHNYTQERPQTSGIHNQRVKPLTSSQSYTLSADDLRESALPATDLKTKLTKWAAKCLHGRYHQQLNQPGTGKEATGTWLRNDIRPKTVEFMFAVQEEVIPTNNYEK
jgi:hypothetical protein